MLSLSLYNKIPNNNSLPHNIYQQCLTQTHSQLVQPKQMHPHHQSSESRELRQKIFSNVFTPSLPARKFKHYPEWPHTLAIRMDNDRENRRRLNIYQKKEQKRIQKTADRLGEVCAIIKEDMEYVTAVWNKELLAVENERRQEISDEFPLPMPKGISRRAGATGGT